jgi:hypothetical protein
MKRPRHAWWLMAVLPLFVAALWMRESRGQQAMEPAAATPQPAAEAEAARPAPPADVEAAEAPAADAGDAEEKVSADNNLSFPVDI